MSRSSLAEIAVKHGTDKQSIAHFYADHYSREFRHLRDEPIVLLELGIGGYADPYRGGHSLRMWEEYFPKAQIVGLDYYTKLGMDTSRIKTYAGRQDDPRVIDRLVERHGPFDLIIDDCSHEMAPTIESFHLLWPHLKPGGIYAIEDLETSYIDTWGGSAEWYAPNTSVRFLTDLINGLNDAPGHEMTEVERQIESIDCYRNLAFIRRWDDGEREFKHLTFNMARSVDGVIYPRGKVEVTPA